MRFLLVLALAALVSGCAYTRDSGPTATDEAVSRAIYPYSGPPKLTLMTSINNTNGSGAHSALMVSASQQVMFDPAGSWGHPQLPEQGDVIYGFSPKAFEFFSEVHARASYHQVYVEIPVTAAQAERALQLVIANGRAPDATCAISISTVLSEIGLTQVGKTWFPKALMKDALKVPGIRTWTVKQDDTDDETDLIYSQHRATPLR